MFPYQYQCDNAKTDPINWPEPGGEPDHCETYDGNNVKGARERERPRDAEPHWNGEKPVRAVELTVLQRVEHVEAGEPEDDGETEEYRYRQFTPVERRLDNGKPGTDRGDR